MIKIFEEFAEIHDEMDPYSEEDWYDENLFKVGDSVQCVDDFGSGLEVGKNYKCIGVVPDEDEVQYLDVVDDNGKRFCFWGAYRFVRVNERHTEIDPYDEEEWDEELWKNGDILICVESSPPELIDGKEYELSELYFEDGQWWVELKNGEHFEQWYKKRFIKKK